MQASRFKMFIKLYQKELQNIKTEILLTVFAVAAASMAVYISGPHIRWTTFLFIMTAGFAGIFPIISAGGMFTREFNHNTIYWVMSLPVGGGMILGSKMAAIISQYLAGTLTVIVSGTVVAYALYTEEITAVMRQLNPIPWDLALAVYFLTIVFGLYVVACIFFSQIIARLVGKFNHIITLGTLFGLLWLTHKLIIPLIRSVNYAQAANLPAVQPILYTALIYSGAAAAVFIASAMIYDRRIEL